MTLMQPVLHWASNLLILGFSAASCISAEHFSLLSHASALCSCTSALLSCALAAFQHLSLIAAPAILKNSSHIIKEQARTTSNL
jgi:hypothetical protein